MVEFCQQIQVVTMDIVIVLIIVLVIPAAFWLDAKFKAEDEEQRLMDQRIADLERMAGAYEIEDEPMPTTDSLWEDIDVPEHRPKGKWVNWKYGSGWLKVRGTSNYTDDIDDCVLALDDFDPGTDTLNVVLERDPSNPFDDNAIEVHAVFKGQTEAEYMLGFIEADAAAWLADNYDPDMPIAAVIVKFSTDYENASITVCGLMPAKKERDQFAL
jgi:hypothetical protein